MPRSKPAHVSCYRDRHGQLRWRFRAPGKPQSQTREPFQSAAWWAWYDAATRAEAAPIGASRVKPGSVNALAVAYYASAEWAQLRPATHTTYRGIIERFRTKHGDKAVATIEAHHIRAMMDAKAATPAAANNLLKVLRALMRFAVERNWRPADPSRAVRPLKYRTEGWHTWTEEEVAAYEAHWPLGTKQRFALDLMLYTGQRSGDARQMTRQQVKGGRVIVKQDKTGAPIDIPIHPALAASLAAYDSGHLLLIATEYGKPFTAAGYGNWVKRATKAAGIGHCSAHGLRKVMAVRLAEAGCSAHEIMAITGHTTLKEVERYTRDAGRKRLADSAMQRIGGTNAEQTLSNLGDRLDKTGSK